MLVWRITRAAYQALDGEGARLNGGRWNSEGVAVVYTSSTLSLAALEYLVHVDPEDVPADLVAMQTQIPDDVPGERLPISALPADWNTVPAHPACATAGDVWAKNGLAAYLRVPSAIVPEEENLLINPQHTAVARIIVVHTRSFGFDPRLLT